MSTGFLGRMLSGCQHQFAWPRRDEQGEYYQLCVNCGSKYRYDWTRMCRTARLTNEIVESASATHPPEKRATWVPRERRMHYEVPVQVRIFGSQSWESAVSENISRSGLAFRCELPLVVGQVLELNLELPKELTGEKPATVICRGTVARVSEAPHKGKEATTYLVACSIADYTFSGKPPARATVEKISAPGMKKAQSGR